MTDVISGVFLDSSGFCGLLPTSLGADRGCGRGGLGGVWEVDICLRLFGILGVFNLWGLSGLSSWPKNPEVRSRRAMPCRFACVFLGLCSFNMI